MTNKSKKNTGFALLMAIMVGSLFLAIGATIHRIALIEIILSSTGKDSQFAFYAADTGLECALYWNYHYNPNGHDGSGSAFSVYNESSGDEVGSNRYLINAGSLPMIDCGGGPVLDFRQGDVQGGFIHQTYFKLDVPASGLCAEVVVTRLPGAAQPPTITEITSHGYNTCSNSDRRVERAIKATLQ
ncbi:MAG: pilus assembly PilX N-terminal domain-containing protein [Patescibacteria group bacterium]